MTTDSITTPEIVLEYLKVALSAPVMSAAVALGLAGMFRSSVIALFERIASLKVAGIGELQTSQAGRPEAVSESGKQNPEPLPAQKSDTAALPESTSGDVASHVRAERERAYLWEYRYLNLFLVRGSQLVLEWFANRAAPTTFPVYDTWWSSLVIEPRERMARVDALRSHYLLVEQNGLLSVSEKGCEYLTWRGPLPNLREGA